MVRGRFELNNHVMTIPGALRAFTLIVCLLPSGCARPELTRQPLSADEYDLAFPSASDPTLATLSEIQSWFAAGELNSETLVSLTLERIATYDDEGPALNAMIAVNGEALATARQLDAEFHDQGARGPLHGVPVILKDNYDTADLPTTGGSAILAGSRAPDDAAVTRRLREGGAVIIGKANMSEFALSYGWLGYGSAVGQTRNPHNTLRDPSGSSSGSAAAVAAGYATLATGTDTAGSIRGPASVNGVVGIKPTMGLVSRDGIIPTSLSLDVPGPIARSVYGAAVMLAEMAGSDAADPATQVSQGHSFDIKSALSDTALEGARLGVVKDFSGANPDVDAVFDAALEALETEGAELIGIDLPIPFENLKPVIVSVIDGDFGPNIEAYLSSLPNGAPRTVADLIPRAESPTIARSATPLNPARVQGFRAAQASGGYGSTKRHKSLEERMTEVRRQLQEIMEGYRLDALVFPTLPCPASPRHDAADPTYVCYIEDPYRPCYIASVSGYPEITVPAGFTRNVLPVGLSLLGSPFTEERLIGLAFDFEQATKAFRVPKHTPSLSDDEEGTWRARWPQT